MSLDYKKHFPFSRPRPEQDRAIKFILESFVEQGKRFVVCELGTGLGKSAIGLTVAQAVNQQLTGERSGSYFLTTQKVLQDQYIDDFGPNALGLMRTIKSSANYQCTYHPNQSCAESRRVLPHVRELKQAADFVKVCSSRCPYSKEKSDFMQCSMSVTNFSYFLSETMYAGKLEPRHLLVIDEAHNIEATLSDFVEIVFSEKFSEEILKCKIPKKHDQQSVFDWVNKKYLPSLKKAMRKSEIEVKKETANGSDISKISKQYELLDKHICKVNRFVDSYDPKNWILNTVLNETKSGKWNRKFEFKPIDVSRFCEEKLFKFGEKVLMMSATIINKDSFCKSVGLDPGEVGFISIPTPFSPENRPLNVLPVGSMSKKNIEQTLPKMAEVIKEILRQHSNEKGIIHATSFKIANYIYETLNDPRILIHDSMNKDDVLRHHRDTIEPTVLLSPSMAEGVNLSDNLSRFQIMCKVPFPYLGDEVVKRRMENDEDWYPYQTAKTVIQALGRSIRNEKDFAVSYILDSDWGYFYQRNRKFFSEDFNKILK